MPTYETMIPRARLAQQHEAIRAELDEAISRVIRRAVFMPDVEVEAFEEEFARYVGVRYAVGVASGGAAVTLALIVLGIEPGDEVISVPNVDLSASGPITQARARIVWTDINSRTYNLDPQKLEDKLTSRTHAIVLVHMYGNPAEINAITEVTGRYDLPIVEDAASAHGATYQGNQVGSFGRLACFSFNPNKILGAFGHAGIVVTNEAELAERIRVFSNYGIEPSSMAGYLDDGSSPRLEYREEGFNARIDELQAAILRVKLRHLGEWVQCRRANAGIYREMLSDLEPEYLLLPEDTPNSEPSYRFFVIRSAQRDALRAYLWEMGIWTGLAYAPPLHLEPIYHYLGYGPGSFPWAEIVAGELLCLPTFPELAPQEVERVGAAIRKFILGA